MKVTRNTWSSRLVGAILASIIAVLAGPPVFAYPIPGPESTPPRTLWEVKTPQHTLVSLPYGNSGWGYEHIHTYHGLNEGSGTEALKMILAHAWQRKSLDNTHGNPFAYVYLGVVGEVTSFSNYQEV